MQNVPVCCISKPARFSSNFLEKQRCFGNVRYIVPVQYLHCTVPYTVLYSTQAVIPNTLPN